MYLFRMIRSTLCLIEGPTPETSNMMHKHLSMDKIAILFENIKELELANLDVGHSATPENKRSIVTSLIFRFVHKKK